MWWYQGKYFVCVCVGGGGGCVGVLWYWNLLLYLPFSYKLKKTDKVPIWWLVSKKKKKTLNIDRYYAVYVKKKNSLSMFYVLNFQVHSDCVC